MNTAIKLGSIHDPFRKVFEHMGLVKSLNTNLEKQKVFRCHGCNQWHDYETHYESNAVGLIDTGGDK